MAIPACTSKNISKNIFQYSLGGLVLGGLSCVVGILGFKFTGIPAGLLIVLSSAFFFLISLIFHGTKK